MSIMKSEAEMNRDKAIRAARFRKAITRQFAVVDAHIKANRKAAAARRAQA